MVGWPSVELYPILLARQKDAATRSEQGWALRSLAATIPPPPEIIPALVDLMETDEEVAGWVPNILGRLGKGAIPWLGAIGRVAEKEVRGYPAPRYNGINALLKIDPTSPEAQRLLGPISRHLRDATVDVDRQQLVWLLDRYGKSAASAVPTLREALQSPVAGVRNDAARILGGLAPSSGSAIADLERLGRLDPEPFVRVSARRALEKLRGSPDEQ